MDEATPSSPPTYDDNAQSISTYKNSKPSGSLVGARRMLFEKQATSANNGKDCTFSPVPHSSVPLTESLSKAQRKEEAASVIVKGRDSVRVNDDGRGERYPVSKKRVPRVSIRTLPLNDSAEHDPNGDEPRRERSSSLSESSCSEPQSRPPSPSYSDDSVFAKRISYHQAVFRSPELILPSVRVPTPKLYSCSEEQEKVNVIKEETSTLSEPKKEQEAEHRNLSELDARDDPASLSQCSVPVVTISKDLSSAKSKDSRLSSSRKICESVVVDKEYDDGHENDHSNVEGNTKVKDVDYPEELNPFSDDEEEENAGKQNEEAKKEERCTSSSYNPFDSDEEEKNEDSKEKEEEANKRKSTNPFWSSDEEEEEERRESKKTDAKLANKSSNKTPVPLPRSVKTPIINHSPQVSLRRSVDSSPLTNRKLSTDSLELSSRSTSNSAQSTMRKKKPAPPPPPVAAAMQNHQNFTNKTNDDTLSADRNEEVSGGLSPSTPRKKVTTGSPWRHKKGPAPARPIPQRRPVKEMPLEDIQIEIADIEIREQELKRQGVQLEQMIHERTEAESAESPAVEEMVLQLFELVNEKNELFRRSSELINMRKMHQLEEEHAELEYQIRCLMLKPPSSKTDSDKEKEEELIKKLLEVVERRNEIIEAMDKDRLRESVEDLSVTKQLGKASEDDVTPDKKKDKEKKCKKHKKEKSNKEEAQQQQLPGEDKEKHLSGRLIKPKFMTMTLRHSAKKLHSKVQKRST